MLEQIQGLENIKLRLEVLFEAAAASPASYIAISRYAKRLASILEGCSQTSFEEVWGLIASINNCYRDIKMQGPLAEILQPLRLTMSTASDLYTEAHKIERISADELVSLINQNVRPLVTIHSAPVPLTTENRVLIGHGHSHVWKDLRDFLQNRLNVQTEEFNSSSAAGISTSDRLNTMLERCNFAFLVLTGEDQTSQGQLRARMNVVHETGLCQGRFGFARAIVLLEDGCEEFSNIHGLGQIRFPKGRVDAVSEQIREVLEREQLLDSEGVQGPQKQLRTEGDTLVNLDTVPVKNEPPAIAIRRMAEHEYAKRQLRRVIVGTAHCEFPLEEFTIRQLQSVARSMGYYDSEAEIKKLLAIDIVAPEAAEYQVQAALKQFDEAHWQIRCIVDEQTPLRFMPPIVADRDIYSTVSNILVEAGHDEATSTMALKGQAISGLIQRKYNMRLLDGKLHWEAPMPDGEHF